MGLTDVLSRKSGVIVGDDVLRLFEYARQKQFAVPAIVRVFWHWSSPCLQLLYIRNR
jgi:fructose-bisphosphate aldolase class II